MKKCALAMFMAALSAMSLCATEFRIEAENLPDQVEGEDGKSGMKISRNQQGCVGKAFLFSWTPKVDGNPNVASGEYAIPAGEYTVWGRALTLGEGWRQDTIKINGKKVGVIGDRKLKKDEKKNTWYWQKLKKVTITAEQKTTKIEVVGGAMARLDSIILSDNAEFDPRAMEVSAIEEIEETEAE